MKLTDKEKTELVKYLEGAISYIDKETEDLRKKITPMRDHLKRLLNEKGMLQKIRKAIK